MHAGNPVVVEKEGRVFMAVGRATKAYPRWYTLAIIETKGTVGLLALLR